MRFHIPSTTLLARCFEDRFQLAGWEILVGRLLLTGFFWGALPTIPMAYTAQPRPAGLGQWIDFTWVANAGSFHAGLVCAKIGLVLYAAGLAVPAGLSAFLLLDVSHNTLASSQGMHGHSNNVTTLTALALLAGHLYYAGRHRSWRSLLFAGTNSGQTALRAARWMLAATYVVAGMSKATYGGWGWWRRAEPFVIQIRKAQDEVLSTWTVPSLADSAQAFGKFLEAHPHAATPMLAAAFLMELGAFLACTTRLRALLLGLGLATFHQMSGWLMGLPFGGHTHLLVILFIMPLSWMVRLGTLLHWRLPLEVPDTPPVSQSRPSLSMLVQAPILSIGFAGFLLWRGEWYPFSNFPMYAVLPPATYSLFATDMQDRPLPFETIGTNARTLKKMLTTELSKLKADGTVRRLSDLTDEHWQTATARVVHRIRDTWHNSKLSDASFKIHRKDYEARRAGKMKITTTQIGSFPSPSSPSDPAPEP